MVYIRPKGLWEDCIQESGMAWSYAFMWVFLGTLGGVSVIYTVRLRLIPFDA